MSIYLDLFVQLYRTQVLNLIFLSAHTTTKATCKTESDNDGERTGLDDDDELIRGIDETYTQSWCDRKVWNGEYSNLKNRDAF